MTNLVVYDKLLGEYLTTTNNRQVKILGVISGYEDDTIKVKFVVVYLDSKELSTLYDHQLKWNNV